MKNTVLLDANVLYPASLRDILMELALAELYHARWTSEIHNEWIDALLKNEPHRQRSKLERTRDIMNEVIPDCLIKDYDHLIPQLTLPDPDDRHVLAAAITGDCNIIVTKNIQDFPEGVLKPYKIEVQHPDDFFTYYLDIALEKFCHAISHIRSQLKNPPMTTEQYLDNLIKQGLTKTVEILQQHTDKI